MKNIKSLLLVLLLALTFVSTCYAEPISVVKFSFSAEGIDDNTKLQGMLVEVNAEGQPSSFGTVQSDGFLYLYGLENELTYELVLKPGSAYGCSECALLDDAVYNVLISKSSSGTFDADSDTLEVAAPLVLNRAAHIVYITVIDQESLPVTGAYVSAFSPDDYTKFAYGTTDVNGEVALRAWVGDMNASVSGVNITSAFTQISIDGNSSVTEKIIDVERADATVQVILKDQNNSTFLVPDGAYASIYCQNKVDPSNYDPSQKFYYFYGNINTGESSGSIQVVGKSDMTYVCGIYLSTMEGGQYASRRVEIQIGSGETQEVELQVLAKDHTATFCFVDQDGNPVTDLEMVSVFANTDFNSDLQDFAFAYMPNSEGCYILSLVKGGVYSASYYMQGSSSGGGKGGAGGATGFYPSSSETKYIAANEFKTYSAAGESGSESFKVYAADANVAVKVQDSNGKPIQSAWVEVLSQDQEKGVFFGTTGSTDENGLANLPALSGMTNYKASAFLPYVDGGQLNPAPVSFDLVAGENSVTLTALEANFDLTINLKLNNELMDDADWAFCTLDGAAQTYANIQNAIGIAKIATSASSYSIFCSAGALVYSQYKMYTGTVDAYHAADGETEGSVDVAMVEGAEYFPPSSTTVPVDSDSVIPLPDGCGEIKIKDGTFPDSVTQATVTIGSNTDGIPGAEDSTGLLDLVITDQTGAVIKTADLENNIEVSLCTDEATDSEEPTGCMVSSTGESLDTIPCSEESEGDVAAKATGKRKFTFVTKSLRKLGLTKSGALAEVIAGPTNVKAKKGEGKQAIVSFTRAEGIQYYKIKIERTAKSKTTATYKIVKAKKAKVSVKLKLKKKGTYQFSVAGLSDDKTRSGSFVVAAKKLKSK